MSEVERFEMTPHPVEFDMYYSPSASLQKLPRALLAGISAFSSEADKPLRSGGGCN